MRKFLIFSLLLALLSSCGEYHRVQKSTDYNYKFDYAKRAFEGKKYMQAITLLSEVVTVFKGTDKAEESLYLLALSHYENKDYISSGAYFHTYYTRYPKGKYTELARFYSGYGYYIDSPESQLDQTGTIKAIEELQAFLDYFPKSDKVSIAQNAIFELQDKLTLKELQNAQLYYNLGNYMGNNYESAVIVAKNAIKDYPYSKYKEELEYYDRFPLIIVLGITRTNDGVIRELGLNLHYFPPHTRARILNQTYTVFKPYFDKYFNEPSPKPNMFISYKKLKAIMRANAKLAFGIKMYIPVLRGITYVIPTRLFSTSFYTEGMFSKATLQQIFKFWRQFK
jgi:outer membrane protein assembly factor BamD